MLDNLKRHPDPAYTQNLYSNTVSESWDSNSRSTHQICQTINLWLNFIKHFMQNTTQKFPHLFPQSLTSIVQYWSHIFRTVHAWNRRSTLNKLWIIFPSLSDKMHSMTMSQNPWTLPILHNLQNTIHFKIRTYFQSVNIELQIRWQGMIWTRAQLIMCFGKLILGMGD